MDFQRSNSEQKPLTEQQQEFTNNLFGALFDKTQGAGIQQNDAKELEAIKLILAAVLDRSQVKSLTNLTLDERDDINDALLLNQYADNPQLDIFIKDRLELSRSIMPKEKATNLLSILADISGKGLGNFKDIGDNSIFGNRFKR